MLEVTPARKKPSIGQPEMNRVLSVAVPATPQDRQPAFRQVARKASLNMRRSSRIDVVDGDERNQQRSQLSNRNKENDYPPQTTSREQLQADAGSSLNLPTHVTQQSAWHEASVDGSSAANIELTTSVRKRTKFAISPARKMNMRMKERDLERLKRQEEIVTLFFGHVVFDKKTQAMVNVLSERLKSPKVASFDYTDEYSREWFKHIFHLNKNLNLNRLNISSETLLTFLKKVSLKFCYLVFGHCFHQFLIRYLFPEI